MLLWAEDVQTAEVEAKYHYCHEIIMKNISVSLLNDNSHVA